MWMKINIVLWTHRKDRSNTSLLFICQHIKRRQISKLFCIFFALCSVNYLEFTERFCELSWNSQNKKEVTLHDHNTTKIKRTNCYEHKRTSNWRLVCESKARPGPAKRAHRQGLLRWLWRQTRRPRTLRGSAWRVWRHSHRRSPTMTALGWLPSWSVVTITSDSQRVMLVDKIGEKKADPRNRTNAHKITSNDSNQLSKASRQAHTNELTSAHWIFFLWRLNKMPMMCDVGLIVKKVGVVKLSQR